MKNFSTSFAIPESIKEGAESAETFSESDSQHSIDVSPGNKTNRSKISKKKKKSAALSGAEKPPTRRVTSEIEGVKQLD